jgi:hypothetical protein
MVVLGVLAWGAGSAAGAPVLLARFNGSGIGASLSAATRRVGRSAALAATALALALALAPAAAAGGCPNEASPGFRSYLPDCRAYELVSPAYKEGFTVSILGVSSDGSQLSAQSTGTFSAPEGTAAFGQKYAIARSSTGWEATALAAPSTQFPSYSLEALSPDLHASLWYASTPQLPNGVYFGPPTGPFARVGPAEPPGGTVLSPAFVGESDDLKRILLSVPSPFKVGEPSSLWPGDTTTAGKSLYEYEATGAEHQEPRLLGITNLGVPATVGAGHLISNCGTYLGGLPPATDAYNAISATGSTVIFTAAPCAPSPPAIEVYARVAQTPSTPAHTIAISEPAPRDCAECDTTTVARADAQFRGASLDGSKVFFTTEQRLLPTATSVGPDLYEYDFNGAEGHRLTLLSRGDPAGARVQGVARLSEDGSHVYFLAEGRLTPNPRGGGCLAALNAAELAEEELTKEGACRPKKQADNLYAYDTATDTISFVATLSGEDRGDWEPRDAQRPAQATRDGRFLAFQSSAHLTPDQHGPQAGQVFEYDTQTEKLNRVSTGQDGYNGDGNSSLYRATIPTQFFGTAQPIQRFTNLAMSADGSRVFFQTEAALTPQAYNGVMNVYEWHEGHVALISDGHDSVLAFGGPAVELIGTNESGLDVFFTTADRLVTQDTDDQIDVYDARVGGGFALPPVLAPCTADSCQYASTVPLRPPMPATSSVPGETIPGALKSIATPKKKPRKKAQRRKSKSKVKHMHGTKHRRRTAGRRT